MAAHSDGYRTNRNHTPNRGAGGQSSAASSIPVCLGQTQEQTAEIARKQDGFATTTAVRTCVAELGTRLNRAGGQDSSVCLSQMRRACVMDGAARSCRQVREARVAVA
jgi:hypothetical protein